MTLTLLAPVLVFGAVALTAIGLVTLAIVVPTVAFVVGSYIHRTVKNWSSK